MTINCPIPQTRAQGHFLFGLVLYLVGDVTPTHTLLVDAYSSRNMSDPLDPLNWPAIRSVHLYRMRRRKRRRNNPGIEVKSN